MEGEGGQQVTCKRGVGEPKGRKAGRRRPASPAEPHRSKARSGATAPARAAAPMAAARAGPYRAALTVARLVQIRMVAHRE